MHTYPKLYKHHKLHHEYKQNSILASQHFNSIDYLFCAAVPAILPSALVRPHEITQLQIGLFLVTTNLDDHLGYAFPWSPVRWFPLWVWNSTVFVLNCLVAYVYDYLILIFESFCLARPGLMHMNFTMESTWEFMDTNLQYGTIYLERTRFINSGGLSYARQEKKCRTARVKQIVQVNVLIQS